MRAFLAYHIFALFIFIVIVKNCLAAEIGDVYQHNATTWRQLTELQYANDIGCWLSGHNYCSEPWGVLYRFYVCKVNVGGNQCKQYYIGYKDYSSEPCSSERQSKIDMCGGIDSVDWSD